MKLSNYIKGSEQVLLQKKTTGVHIYGSMISDIDHQRWINEKESYEAIIPTHTHTKQNKQTNKKPKIQLVPRSLKRLKEENVGKEQFEYSWWDYGLLQPVCKTEQWFLKILKTKQS